MSTFRVEFADLAGNVLGELLNAKSRVLTEHLNVIPSFAAQIRRDNPLSSYVLNVDETLVKVYIDDLPRPLRFQGPIVTFERNASDGVSTIDFTAMGAAWRYGFALIGSSSVTPYGVMFPDTAGHTEDAGVIMRQMLDTVNTQWYRGIDKGTAALSTSTATPRYYFKPVLEAWNELSSVLGGPDWEVEPIEPTGSLDFPGGGRIAIGKLNVAAALGQLQEGAVFEFGTGQHNVASFKDQGDAGGLANEVWALPGGFPDNVPQPPEGNFALSYDLPSQSSRGLYQTVLAQADMGYGLRQALTDANVRIRRTPRRVISFVPARQTAPVYGVDYYIGDVVPFTAVEEGQTTIDANFRVFGAQLSETEEGDIMPTLTLFDDTAVSSV